MQKWMLRLFSVLGVHLGHIPAITVGCRNPTTHAPLHRPRARHAWNRHATQGTFWFCVELIDVYMFCMLLGMHYLGITPTDGGQDGTHSHG